MESRKRAKALKGKGGSVAIAVVIVLACVIWWDARYGRPQDPTQNPRAMDFAGIRPDRVSRVQVRGVSTPYELVKRGEEWRLVVPIRAPASKTTVEDALKSLLDSPVSMHTQDRIPNRQLKKYGLDKPSVEFILDGGETIIQIGASEEDGGGYYGRVKRDQRVFLLGNSAVEALKNKKPEDLRDKSVLAIADSEKVTRLMIEGPKGTVELARSGEKWNLRRPLNAQADESEVSYLLSQVKDTQAVSFIENGARELAKYGLERPRMTITVADDRGTHVLAFGSETKEKEPKVYAYRRGEPDVMLLEKRALENLDKGPAELHTRTMLGFDTTKAERVSVRNPSGFFEMTKRGEDWWLVKPVSAKADSGRASSLVSSLSGSALRFVEERPTSLARFGLDKPAVEATVQVQGEAPMRYFIGKLADPKEKSYYAKTSKSAAVFEVAEYVHQDVDVKLDQIKAK